MMAPALIKDYDSKGRCQSCGTLHLLVDGEVLTEQEYREDRSADRLYDQHVQP